MEYNSENKYIVDLNILNTYSAKGCEACNQKFNLGDTVVWPADRGRMNVPDSSMKRRPYLIQKPGPGTSNYFRTLH